MLTDKAETDASGFPAFYYDGLAYPPNVTMDLIEGIENFPVEDGDVFVVGFPKSGTNLVDIILANLYDHWTTTKLTPDKIVPELAVPEGTAEGLPGFQSCLKCSSPRLIRTHLPFDRMPRAFREGRGKAVYIARNPKDVCESHYENVRAFLGDHMSWDEFIYAFIEGTVPFGPYVRNLLTWNDPSLDDRVLRLTFEDLVSDKRAGVHKIVDFLGAVPAEKIDQMVEQTSFKAMKTNELGKQFQPGAMRRKGKIGGWKGRFTVEQSELFDLKIDALLRLKGIHLKYEDPASTT